MIARLRRWIGCPLSKAWKWWAEPSPQRRLAAWLVVCAVVAWGFAVVQSTNDQTREIVDQQAEQRAAGRVANATNLYGLCEATNVAIGKVDTLVLTLGALVAEGRPNATEEQTERLAVQVARLRSGLDLRDCSVYLRDLTPPQRDTARNTTVPPTLPRSSTTIHQ